MSNNVLEAVQLFGFPFFAIFAIIHPVCMLSLYLSPDSGSSYDILDLVDVIRGEERCQWYILKFSFPFFLADIW